MKYPLDVNALVALGFIHHEFHDRVAEWIKAQQLPELATCSITELGFVRILSQAPAYGFYDGAGTNRPPSFEERQGPRVHIHCRRA
jgi:predicted nucleic acid-binding protein